MPTGTRDPMLHTGAMVTMCDLQGIRDSEVGLKRCLPITAGREIRLKLNAKPALLLLAVLLVIPGAGLSFAPDAAAQQGSATSVNEAAGHGKAVPGSSPGEIPEQEEHGLPQKAVEIARPFGFPITNSMLVSWIVALGLIVFAQLATRNMKRVPEGAQNFLENGPVKREISLDQSRPAVPGQSRLKRHVTLQVFQVRRIVQYQLLRTFRADNDHRPAFQVRMIPDFASQREMRQQDTKNLHGSPSVSFT